MRAEWLFVLLPLLGGCERYTCGDAVFETSFGVYEAGEWCGEFGTYALESAAESQLIITPSSADDDIDAATITFTPVWSVSLPPGSFVEDSDYSTDDEGVTATCTITPGGVGSGTIRTYEASRAELTVGRPRSTLFSDGPMFDMTWLVDCGPTLTASGSDMVPVSGGL